MRSRITALFVVAVAALSACAEARAAMVPIYRDALDDAVAKSRVLRLVGHRCERGGLAGTLRIVVGPQTETCVYRTPVMGRNLEVATVARLLAQTPRAVARKAFLGLVLRAGGGSRYEMRVFPAQRKVQLLRTKDGETSYLAVTKRVAATKGIGSANVLRLRAEGDHGRVKLTARLGREVVAEALDEGGEVEGEYSAVTVGAPGSGRAAAAAFDVVVVRVPVRF